MANETKLAVILHADVVGSTGLVQRDESLAHERIRDAFRRFTEIASHHGGKTHEIRGDALVAEFSRVSDAAVAAIDFQARNSAQNEALEGEIRPVCRVGIALGEVIIADNMVTGAGVVLAQRLEQLAQPGGVCVSAAVHEAVPKRLPFEFETLGEQSVKGFDEPVRVYSVSMRAGEEIPEPANRPYADESRTSLATPTLHVPAPPSIAVLPFSNLSGDPDQEYFADGMTEDIITALSRFRSLLVVARNSSFAYKGQSPDVRDVARELAVRYVLEGSVRRGGDRLRISGQLIDAETGSHLWVERYDRELTDIFMIQDEVTESIVAAIAPEIGNEERRRAQRKPPENLEAWDIYQHGLVLFHSSTTKEEFWAPIEQFDMVNKIDPTFAPAYAMAAAARTRFVAHFSPDDSGALLTQAREKASKAITLDPRDPLCLCNHGRVHSLLGHHEVAVSNAKDAIALNPNDAMSHHYLGVVLCTAGRSEEAIPHFDRAMQLSPRDIFLPGMQTYRAFALFDLERYDEACLWVQRAHLSPHPRPLTFALLSAVLLKLERKEEALKAMNDLLVHAPEASCSKYRENQFGSSEAMERFANALLEAGLRE